jgi:hypothetical protein
MVKPTRYRVLQLRRQDLRGSSAAIAVLVQRNMGKLALA